MDVHESAIFLLLMLYWLDCSIQLQPPIQLVRKEVKPHYYQARQIRDVRRLITASKTSRAALQYGLDWALWRRGHSKVYSSPEEELEKYVVWRSNTAYIEYHNNYADKFGFSLAMNKYGDMVSVSTDMVTGCM